MKFSIIIPCYNEAKNLPILINVLSHFPSLYDVEFIIVENGSHDNSKKLLMSLPELDNKRIKPIYIDVNQGYGYGILQGLKVAEGEYLGWIHADLQLQPSELLPFMNHAQYSQDYLFMKGIRTNRTLFEKFFTIGMTIFASLTFGTYLYDIGSIPVLFHRSLLNHMEKASFDFSLDLFTYYTAKKYHYTVWRKKVFLGKRELGKSSWNTGLKSRFRLSKLIIKDSFKIKRGEAVR